MMTRHKEKKSVSLAFVSRWASISAHGRSDSLSKAQAWKEFSFCFVGWNTGFWSSQPPYKKCETLRTPQQEGALTRPWVEPTKDAKGSCRAEPAALESCSLCYSHQHSIATVWGSASQTQPSGPFTNSSQRRRDNKMGTAGFATNSRKHNTWCSGNHLFKKSSSSYHLWSNQPLPCSFNSEVLLNNVFCFLVSFSTLPSFIPLGLPQYRCGFLSLPPICIIVNNAVQCIVAVIRAFPTPNNIFISAPLVSSRKFRCALNV